MSIASEITRLQTAKADLKTSIEAKGVTVPSSAKLDDYPDLVDSIPSGGGVSGDVVFFYDYEGTLVESYTGDEIQALSTLPSSPDHSTDEVPLTFDEWNWTLAQIKAYNTSYPEADINVGAIYHTTDNKAHFYFDIACEYGSSSVEIILDSSSYTKNVDTIDWGDGTIETLSTYDKTHAYTSNGKYHCVVTSTSVSYALSGSSSQGQYTRQKCYKVLLPNTVTTFNDSCFNSCLSLKSINIPSSVITIGNYALSECYSLNFAALPSTITNIGINTFNSCFNLKNASIPDSLPITNYFFVNCFNLGSVTIPSVVTTIKQNAFRNCYSLNSIILPNNITSIEDNAFYFCSNLKSITIPNGVISIGVESFYNCYSLQNVTFSNTIESIGNKAFYYCNSLKMIELFNSVTTIGNEAFKNCYSVEKLTLSNVLNTIGYAIFSGLRNIHSVEIPQGITTLSSTMFEYCISLQSVTIAASVTEIGTAMFQGISRMSSCIILSTTPPTLPNTSVFSSTPNKIYVPAESVEIYKTATNWSAVASKIEAIPA